MPTRAAYLLACSLLLAGCPVAPEWPDDTGCTSNDPCESGEICHEGECRHVDVACGNRVGLPGEVSCLCQNDADCGDLEICVDNVCWYAGDPVPTIDEVRWDGTLQCISGAEDQCLAAGIVAVGTYLGGGDWELTTSEAVQVWDLELVAESDERVTLALPMLAPDEYRLTVATARGQAEALYVSLPAEPWILYLP